MKQSQMHITENSRIARDVYRMRLAGDCTGITQPGQFVNLQLDGCFLRRPISVSDWSDDSLTLIYKTVGKGTEQMSRMLPGESLNILTGLGNGYTLSRAGDHPLLIGGGVGVPPLYGLALSSDLIPEQMFSPKRISGIWGVIPSWPPLMAAWAGRGLSPMFYRRNTATIMPADLCRC